MSDSQFIDKLRDHRSLLLACEAIGWLHPTGKAHPDFLRNHGGQQNNYEFKNWCTYDLDKQFDWLKESTIIKWPDKLNSFLQKFDEGKSKETAVGLLQAAHAMASGIEKNHPSNSTKYLGQDVTHMWRTTAFGHPVKNLLEDPPDILKNGSWDELLKDTEQLLNDLKSLGTDTSMTGIEKWHTWRKQSIDMLGRSFSQTLAETRIPNNDVTLWDQSYVAAALFKSAAAGAVLCDKMNWSDLKQSTRWRVLTIGIGADHYEARSVRIGDWIGAKSYIDAFFDNTCKFIEVELALGSLLYRDDQVLVFSFPGCSLDNGNGVSNETAEKLRSDIEQKIKISAQNFDTPPVIRLSDSTRSMILMAKEIDEARKRLKTPMHCSRDIPAGTKTGGHICPVCLLRPTGKDKKQDVCKICAERRSGRLKDWRDNELDSDTIWISEVADENDRVALLTLSLDLSGWLNGDHVDSLRSQSIAEWASKNPTTKNNLPVNSEQMIDLIKSALGDSNEAGKNRSLIQKKLAPGLKDEGKNDVPWDEYYKLMVHDRSDAPSWKNLDDDQRAHWLAHQFFRKNASPGRVRRFWETTQTFFDELLIDFRAEAAKAGNRWRTARLNLTANNGSWEKNQTYAGQLGGGEFSAPFEVLCIDKAARKFVTICNLARILKEDEAADLLKGRTFEAKDDGGEEYSLTITDVCEMQGNLETYHPLIVLERSPARFRLLVPLSAVDNCVQLAFEKWEKEFARVWDRLPLRVGVAGFPRKTPYQAVVEAARNIEDDLTENSSERWRVHEVKNNEDVTVLSLVREDDEHQVVTVPKDLPDGREDFHYPYCAVENSAVREPHDFVAPGSGMTYRLMSELRTGDGIFVSPSRMGRIFLDSSARRFEQVNVRYGADRKMSWEIWGLIKETAPGLTAARALEAIINEKKQQWTAPGSSFDMEAWLDFVRASLVNLWSAKGKTLDALVEAARTGILQETLTWHLHVLKQKMES